MNDNDLFQYAANACGYGTLSYGVLNGYPMLKTISGYRVWNPRDDSGTSLELFVKLEIQVIPPDKCSQIAVAIYCDIDGDTHQFPQQVINGNKYAATRLAILRAAAAIGKSIERIQMTLNAIQKWQQAARPANEDDVSSALGIFLEAVAEVLDEFTQLSVKHDGVTALADMLHDLAMFSHELKTWQIEVSVPDYALKNLIKKTSDVVVTSISLVHVLRSLNFKHFVDRMPLHNDKVIKGPVLDGPAQADN